MKKITILLSSLFFTLIIYSQEAIIKYAMIAMWEGGESDFFYNQDDFNQKNYGVLTSSNSLYLKSGQLFVAKRNGGDIIDADMYYRIYKEGTTPGEFINANLPWHSEWWEDSWLNQLWWNDAPDEIDLNLLNGITDGTYIIEVYFQMEDGNNIIHYLNNNGNNYKARFTYSSGSYVKNNNLDKVSVYPNPANDNVLIKFSENISAQEIEIINNSSEIILQRVMPRDNNPEISFNTSGFLAGSYFIRIKTDNEVFVKKLVIAK